MGRLTEFTKVVFVAMLCASSIQGCAQMNTYAQADDCRTCHVSNLAPGAKDFSSIYADTSSHHPVDIKYPASVNAHPDFNQPDRRRGNISFFDSNANGQADSDEIQLFEQKGVMKVVCASCHREHGNAPAPLGTPANFYLRVDNINSALCMACHNK